MHVHVSALEFLVTVAYMIIGGFFLSVIATRYPDSQVSKALAFIKL